MKKSEYLNKMADKSKERAEYYRQIGEKDLDVVEEENSTDKKKGKKGSILERQLERLVEVSKVIYKNRQLFLRKVK